MHKWKREQKITGTGGAGKELVAGLFDRKKPRWYTFNTLPEPAKASPCRGSCASISHPGAQLMTDELATGTGLEKDYVHQFVNHAESYVRGNVHVNGVENFFEQLARADAQGHLHVL